MNFGNHCFMNNPGWREEGMGDVAQEQLSLGNKI